MNRTGGVKAGIFNAQRREKWTWVADELFDESGTVIADVRADVLYVADEHLLIETTLSPVKFRCRATTSSGVIFTINQDGFSTAKLTAQCGSRQYSLWRVSLWRKKRVISRDGTDVAKVLPHSDGSLTLEFNSASGVDFPVVDAVFLSWGCVLADATLRRTKI